VLKPFTMLGNLCAHLVEYSMSFKIACKLSVNHRMQINWRRTWCLCVKAIGITSKSWTHNWTTCLPTHSVRSRLQLLWQFE